MQDARRRRFWLRDEHRRRRSDATRRLANTCIVLCLAIVVMTSTSGMTRGAVVPDTWQNVVGSGTRCHTRSLSARNDPNAVNARLDADRRVSVGTTRGGKTQGSAGWVSDASRSPCQAKFVWPVTTVSVLRGFEPPAKPWLSGHRGVDLATRRGDELKAPAQGIISFAGTVAGKSVVSIRHGEMTSTFEPASTALSVGDAVRQGEPFAQVQGASDHCADSCVHWGIKRQDGYLDPVAQTLHRRIALKPAI